MCIYKYVYYIYIYSAVMLIFWTSLSLSESYKIAINGNSC